MKASQMGLVEGRLHGFSLLLLLMFVRPFFMNQIFMSWRLVINAVAPKNRKVRDGASGRPRSR